MERFIEDLINRYKWENFVLLVAFLEILGLIFIFVWNREVFLAMDIIKLLLFSFSISFLIFIPNVLFSTLYDVLQEVVGKELSNTFLFWGRAVLLTWMIMGSGIIYKLYNHNYTVINFIVCTTFFLLGITVLKLIVVLICYIRNKLSGRQ